MYRCGIQESQPCQPRVLACSYGLHLYNVVGGALLERQTMIPKHHLQWRQTRSHVMIATSAHRDEGVPCVYMLSFRRDSLMWQASIEGATLKDGTLQECMLACQEHEYESLK